MPKVPAEATEAATARINELEDAAQRGYRTPDMIVRLGLEAAAPFIVAAVYHDVRHMMADYGDTERDVIASMPFAATLDQLMIEFYGLTAEQMEPAPAGSAARESAR